MDRMQLAEKIAQDAAIAALTLAGYLPLKMEDWTDSNGNPIGAIFVSEHNQGGYDELQISTRITHVTVEY